MSVVSTHGNDAGVHFIEAGRFVCKADASAPCRNYPACTCEDWEEARHFGHGKGETPEPGHEAVPQDECWMDPWLNNSMLHDSYSADDLYIDDDEFPNGPVETTWEGDYLLWEYADDTRPVVSTDDD